MFIPQCKSSRPLLKNWDTDKADENGFSQVLLIND